MSWIVLRNARSTPLTRPSFISTSRSLSSASYFMKERGHESAPEWRSTQKSKPLNPHLTNTTSTEANNVPKVGANNAPPDQISSISSDFEPTDSKPENTIRMTGGTQAGKPQGEADEELDVGEMEGAQFKVHPLRRTGEDINTIRARLLCPFSYARLIDCPSRD